ncbi:MAG: lipase family protein, partial [Chloroflexi bacterium]|nr:lipase family protein [Chloroflexota bacterium]
MHPATDPASSDPVLSLPPIKRAAYSDRTAVLMAEMSRLAYIPFEQPRDKDLDQVIGQIRASKNDEHARNILNDFYRNYRTAGQNEARQELVNGLARLGFKLVSTYAVGETQAFLSIKEHLDGRGSGAPGILVLSFRGTERKVQDWKTDLKARKTIMRLSGIPVHQGFWEAFNLVRPKISSDLAPLIDAGYTLYMTGHSLGGALALIATREIGSDSTGACYTFGQPRVSGYGFAQQIKTPIYRVVNASDIVPRVPPSVLPKVLLFALRIVRFPGRVWL